MRIFESNKKITTFSSKNKPNFTMEDGEIVLIKLEDCYGGQITNENDKRSGIDGSVINAAVGPIHVKHATVNDSLCIEILNIKIAEQGVMVLGPGLGILGDAIDEYHTRIIEIKEGNAVFSNGIKIPVNPMIGVIGVSPEKDEYSCSSPGNHGGNMDTKEITIGSKIHLPVFVDGGNFALTDLHACMGDGEVSGTGIEVSGEVILKVSIRKNAKIYRPRVETEKDIFFIASDESLIQACRKATHDIIEELVQILEIDFLEALRLVSATCDYGISQIVNDKMTVKVKVPKYLCSF